MDEELKECSKSTLNSGRALYRPPGIPVLVGSDTFGRVQSGIPTQRPGPETRNTVILGCIHGNASMA